MATTAQLIEDVRTAIQTVAVVGQAYTLHDGTQRTHADLGELREMLRELEAIAAAEAGPRARLLSFGRLNG